MDISGLVLCGGKSTRMGTDKGSLLKDGKPWARIVSDQILALEIPCLVSVNKDQLKDYKSIFKEQELIIDQLDVPGPLRGLLSAHQRYPERDWLLMACDMIDMDEHTLRRLMNAKEEMPGMEFYVYRNEKYYQPFAGIYTAAGLQRIYDMYRNGLLEDFSLQHVLYKSKTYSLSLKTNEAAFRNYNSL